MAESRAHRVICLLVGIWTLNAFDLTLTILSHQQGMLEEQNPVARHILGMGPSAVMLFKIVMVLLGSFPLFRFRSTRIAELGALVVVVAYAFLALRWSVCVDLYTLSISGPLNLADSGVMPQLSPQ